MNDTPNPLLAATELPPFSQISPAHVVPAITRLISENRQQVAQLTASDEAPNAANFLNPLAGMDERLDDAWSPISHLNAVAHSSELREAYNQAREQIVIFGTEIGQNRELYERYQQLRDSDEFSRLDPYRQRSVELALRDFRLSGVSLEGVQRERYAHIMQRLSTLAARFAENVLDATDAWNYPISNEKRLAGLPQQARAAAAARAGDKQGWLITLDMPCYHAVMTHADDRVLRRAVYEAFVTRASEQGPDGGRWDNSKVMAEMLELRHEAAGLLGFGNWAEYSLATKMADSPDQVEAFLGDLASRSQAAASKEYAELKAFSQKQLELVTLEPWDIMWASEKLRVARYAISDDELQPYFPLPAVLQGLLEIAGRLFNISFRNRKEVDCWHQDVHFFDVLNDSEQVIAGFYLDPSARPGKRSGAWMDICRNRSANSLPVAYLTCNFAAAGDDHVTLLTHNEVNTLFHEFGHGLHLMLTEIDFPAVGGLNAVEWDAVELPSQLMENWAWEKQALDLFARHFETDQALPPELFERLRGSRTFQAAMRMTRQLEFALFDLRMHADYDPHTGARILDTLNEVRAQVAIYAVPDWNRFPHGFSHIFGGGYAAGYYSYLWAEVMSQDAFSAFEETDVFDVATGARFRSEVLAKGSSRPASESYRAFRGRDPQIAPLLKTYGLG